MKYLAIAAAAVVTVLVLSVSLKGCTFTTPTPIAQTASQTSHVIGFMVINSGNQTINQGVYPKPDGGDGAIVSIALLLLLVALVLGGAAMFWNAITGHQGG